MVISGSGQLVGDATQVHVLPEGRRVISSRVTGPLRRCWALLLLEVRAIRWSNNLANAGVFRRARVRAQRLVVPLDVLYVARVVAFAVAEAVRQLRLRAGRPLATLALTRKIAFDALDRLALRVDEYQRASEGCVGDCARFELGPLLSCAERLLLIDGLLVLVCLQVHEYTRRHRINIERHKLVVEGLLVAALNRLVEQLLAGLRVELVEAHEDETCHLAHLSHLILHCLRKVRTKLLRVLCYERMVVVHQHEEHVVSSVHANLLACRAATLQYCVDDL